MPSKFSSDCEKYALKVDEFLDQKDYDGLERYLSEVQTFAKTHDTWEYTPVLYYLGTGYTELANNLHRAGRTDKDNDVVEYRKWSMFYFRKALEFLEETPNDQLLLPLLINYANTLSACGRVLEAIRLYREAVAVYPSFAMAVANYGKALSTLATTVNDKNQCRELHCYAYQAMNRALKIEDPNFYKEARCSFEKTVNDYPRKVRLPVGFLKSEIKFKTYDLGGGEEEQYRKWCLQQHLFLNPLNEVMECESAFAHDPLIITRYTEGIEENDSVTGNTVEPPRWFAMVNQLKEEYIYSRYLCFVSMQLSGDVHYADKDVKLSNGLDFSNYSIRLEQMKSAYKILYGMFDQMAFLINDFWKLGFKERYADAKKVFKAEKYPTNNLMLKAIMWTYQEFWDKYGDSESAHEKDLADLRNALEHKFVKIHECSWDRKLKLEKDSFYHTDERKFKELTFRLLVLVRETLMYLVYAIDLEEKKKKDTAMHVQMPVSDYEDEWKR